MEGLGGGSPFLFILRVQVSLDALLWGLFKGFGANLGAGDFAVGGQFRVQGKDVVVDEFLECLGVNAIFLAGLLVGNDKGHDSILAAYNQ